MKSKIMVEMDFDLKEPYIQFYVSDTNIPGTSVDLADKTLNNFVKDASSRGLYLVYPEDTECNQPQVRLGNPKTSIMVSETSQEFRDWLDKQDIPFSVFSGHLVIEEFVNEFNLALKWADYKFSNK